MNRDDDGEGSVDFNFYFVRFPPSDDFKPTPEELAKFNEAFELLQEQRIFPQWIDGEECVKLMESRDYFIVPAFRGPIFDKMAQRKFKVYGGPIFIECIMEEKALPNWSHPVYSSNFEGVNLSFTGVPTDERQRLARIIGHMNGKFSGDLSSSTTHLIVRRADATSEKYKTAVANKIPLMKEDWIEYVWEQAQKGATVKAGHLDMAQAYTLPLFHGLTMSLSGIVGEDRTNVGRMMELNGAKLSTTMARATCTHLITEKPSGEKFKKATEWGTVKIVTTRWLRKCIDQGCVIDESKYHPTAMLERVTSSTPLKANETIEEKAPDVSRISGTGGRVPYNSTIMNSSMGTTPSTMATFNERRIFAKASSQITVKKDEPIFPVRSASSRALMSASSSVQIAAPVVDLDVTAVEDYDFFEGCMVFLYGTADHSKLEQYRRLLDRTGATRVQRIEAATHVIVIAPTVQEKAELKRIMAKGTTVTTANWMVECYKQKDFLPPEDFVWNDEQVPEVTEVASSSSSASASAVEAGRCSNGNSRQAMSIHSAPSLAEKNSRPNSARCSPDIPQRCLAPTKFHLHRSIDEKKTVLLRNLMSKMEGKVATQNPILLVIPLISNTEVFTETRGGSETIISDYYMRKLEKSAETEINTHPFKIPILVDKVKFLFDKLVFVTEGFDELDTEYIDTLITATGGFVQKVIAVKEKPGVRIVTHVIAAVENERIEKCRKTKRLKVVDLSWLIDCVTQKSVLPESEYLFEKESLHNWSGRMDTAWKSWNSNEATASTKSIESTARSQEDDFDYEEVLERRISMGKVPSYKMNLQLDGLTQALNDIPSPIRTQETLNSTAVGNLLKRAVENTSKKSSENEDRPVPQLEKSKSTKRKSQRDETALEPSSKRTSVVEEAPTTPPPQASFIAPSVTPSGLTQTSQIKSPLATRDTNLGLTDSQQIAAFGSEEDSFNRDDFIRHFLVSGLTNPLRGQLHNMINKLGGKVDEHYTRVTTHLITTKMLRSPKALCIVAAGKWCLTEDYITESYKRGGWLKEDAFEWNPFRVDREKSENAEQEIEFSKAVSKWRTRIADLPYMDSNRWETNGAFMSWKCVLHLNDRKAMKTLEILRAGGASVNTVDSFVDVLSYKPNYVFASPDFEWDKKSAKRLTMSSVKVLNFEYIYQFLVNDEVTEEQWLHVCHEPE